MRPHLTELFRAQYVHTLLIWTLLLGSGYGSATSPDCIVSQKEPVGISLTNERPTGSFSIDPEALASAPPILKLTVSQVVNPNELPFQIFVYLSLDSQPGGTPGTHQERILIGNFGLYPPDHPASFLLRTSRAFSKLKTMTANPTNVHLLLEMKRIHEASPWSLVEVTVAPPEWQRK
jgi:hypothetical protein